MIKKSYDIELKTLKKYRESIQDLKASLKYVKKGEGIKYTQPKRNGYKISLINLSIWQSSS